MAAGKENNNKKMGEKCPLCSSYSFVNVPLLDREVHLNECMDDMAVVSSSYFC